MDCHAGNPCDLKSDPTTQSLDQQKDLEKMKAINRAIQLRVLEFFRLDKVEVAVEPLECAGRRFMGSNIISMYKICALGGYLTTTTTSVDNVGSPNASSSAGHTSKDDVIDVGSNSVDEGFVKRGKTLPISKPGCVLCQDIVAFCLKTKMHFSSRPFAFYLKIVAFYLKTKLHFASRPSAFCLKISAFCRKTKLRIASRPFAFCIKTYCVLFLEDCVLERSVYVDIRATKILLQGLPKDIYTLINHYTDAKDIWDNVKMLLEGSKLTKKDQKSQLYDDFEHFRQHKGESIHNYYGRFVTAVKLNRGLRDSNYDQLYAYLKQHETHSHENKMMLERFSQPTMDPLALMSNVSNQQHYSSSSSTSSFTQVPQPIADLSLSPAESLIENLTNALALLTQSYKTFLPQTNNQLRTLSNARNQATVQDGRMVVQNVQGRQNRGQGMNPWCGSAARYGGAQNKVGNVNPGARPGPARPVKCYNCNDKMLLMQAQENGVALDEEQLLFLAGGHDNAFDDDVDEQPAQDLALNMDNVFQADDCDAFDSDVDEAPTAQTMFMANLSSADPIIDEAGPSYDSDILSEVQDHDHYQDAVCAHYGEHVMHDSVQLDHVVDSHANYTSDCNMIPYD
nr:hypothetical protein [Tanacetum cinerariifolium]